MSNTLQNFYKEYLGRPTPLYHAKTLSKALGAEIYLKREDLNHTGSFHINNVFEQLFYAKKEGYAKVYLEAKDRDLAVACAAGCARLDMQLCIESESFDTLSRFRLNLYGIKKVDLDSLDDSYFYVDENYFSNVIANELSQQIKEFDTLITVSENPFEFTAIFTPFRSNRRCIAVDLKDLKDPLTMKAFTLLAQSEGIVCSFKSALSIAYLMKHKPKQGEKIVIVLGENGDKDIPEAYEQITV